MTDAEIIARVLNGEKDLFAELVRRHHQKAIGLALSLLRNKTEAEDAAQDSFIKAYQALSSFRQGDAHFSTWLYQITYNHCLDLLRKRTREKKDSWDALMEEHGEKIQALLADDGIEQAAENTDLANRVLSALSPEHRNILILREINGLSYEEIGTLLHCSLDAVKGRLKRARIDLEEKLRHLVQPSDV